MSKKIINAPADAVREMAEGFLAAYGDRYEQIPGVAGLRVKERKDKVAVVIGGGSGHEPTFAFMLGQNMADASASGNVFTSPDPNTILQTALAANTGKGVLFVYGNYAGDNMNFDIAAEMLEDMGIPSRTVRVHDDIASAPKGSEEERRGIAGGFFVIHTAGAAAAAGLSLDEVYQAACHARDNVWSAGFSLAGVTLPGEKAPIFTLPEDQVEYGIGIHGEAGVQRMPLLSADEMTTYIVDRLMEDSGLKSGDTVATLVNGLGAITLMEKLIMNRKLSLLLQERGVGVHTMDVGDYVTSLDMKGISISLLRLDDSLRGLHDTVCGAPFCFRNAPQLP